MVVAVALTVYVLLCGFLQLKKTDYTRDSLIKIKNLGQIVAYFLRQPFTLKARDRLT